MCDWLVMGAWELRHPPGRRWARCRGTGSWAHGEGWAALVAVTGCDLLAWTASGYAATGGYDWLETLLDAAAIVDAWGRKVKRFARAEFESSAGHSSSSFCLESPLLPSTHHHRPTLNSPSPSAHAVSHTPFVSPEIR